ncbi:Hypothetical_protein [Hexamita inflata]|uniref:Hypothetical_protein n=1 Tax=Hexamita inflata TaxID=28002 RepID=A0AA86UUG7_9EUKA|nr:Hypothetical protein HINF_LOCUS52726 [Hexamita inflata]
MVTKSKLIVWFSVNIQHCFRLCSTVIENLRLTKILTKSTSEYRENSEIAIRGIKYGHMCNIIPPSFGPATLWSLKISFDPLQAFNFLSLDRLGYVRSLHSMSWKQRRMRGRKLFLQREFQRHLGQSYLGSVVRHHQGNDDNLALFIG